LGVPALPSQPPLDVTGGDFERDGEEYTRLASHPKLSQAVLSLQLRVRAFNTRTNRVATLPIAGLGDGQPSVTQQQPSGILNVKGTGFAAVGSTNEALGPKWAIAAVFTVHKRVSLDFVAQVGALRVALDRVPGRTCVQ
jgi:hypothetical protein